MAIELNGTTGITTPDINTTAQSTDITTTGDISAVDVTASGGVYLGGTASANYLDYYEEGTWTPNLVNNLGTPLFVDNNLTIINPRYVKAGKLVFYSCYIYNDTGFSYNTGISSSTFVYINGLPFVADGYHSGSCGYFNNFTGWGAGYTPMLITESGSGFLRLNYANTNSVTQMVASSFLSASSGIIVSGCYSTSF